MPCTYTGSLEGDRALGEKEATDKLTKEITRLTRILCGQGKLLNTLIPNKSEYEDHTTPAFRHWYREHSKVDEKRLEKLEALIDDLVIKGLKSSKPVVLVVGDEEALNKAEFKLNFLKQRADNTLLGRYNFSIIFKRAEKDPYLKELNLD